MTVSFTYANFPHLWDSIIAHTTQEAQLTLRLVCKSLCSVIDNHQSRHLVLSCEMIEEVLVTGPHHHIPYFEDLDHNFLELWRRQRTVEVTSSTRALDVQGYFPPSSIPVALERMSFPRLEVLRMTNSLTYEDSSTSTPYVPFRAKTLVLFNTEGGMDDLMEHWWFKPSAAEEDEESSGDMEAPMVPRGVDRETIPDSYEKVVINLKGYEVTVNGMFPFTTDLPPHVKEVVIVAPDIESLGHEGMINDMNVFILMGDLGDFIAPGQHHTLVGFERLDAPDRSFKDALMTSVTSGAYVGVDSSIDGDAMQYMPPDVPRALNQEAERLRKRHKDRVGGPGSDERPPFLTFEEKVNWMRATVEFVDIPTYVKRVGVETATLELVEDLDPRDVFLRGNPRGSDWRRKTFYDSEKESHEPEDGSNECTDDSAESANGSDESGDHGESD